jgi:long-chain acyl-CoA synthetase
MPTPRWGSTVVESTRGGHPGLKYEYRPSSVRAILSEARRWSNRVFITHGSRVVTFGEHEQLVHRVAAMLTARGIKPGQRVGILAANSPEWVATFFAIIEIGGVVVPFNGWWAADEVAYAAGVVDPVLIVTDEQRQGRVPENVPFVLVSQLGESDAAAIRSAATPAAPTPAATASSAATSAVPAPAGTAPVEPDLGDADEDAPAVILFTAGTTAFPKGAILSHRALIANLQTLLVTARKLPQDIADDIRPSVALVGLPLFHIGAIQLILVPLMTGSQIVFLEGRFDAAAVLRLIASHGVTMFSGVPTMMERMLQQPVIGELDLSSLRTIILGGSPVDQALLSRIRSAFPSAVRGVGQTYGLTEAGGVVSTGAGKAMAEHPGSSGRLAPVVEVRIDAPDAEGNGEILVRSPACMDGYWGGVDDAAIDADGWFRTGDLGRVDNDRYLYVTGRAKDVIIRGGENISAARVESVLNAHPGVLEVSVIGLPDADLGEVVAAVVRAADPAPSQAELEEFAKSRLSAFETPTRWWFREGLLPTNDSGKVLRTKLVNDWAEAASIRS